MRWVPIRVDVEDSKVPAGGLNSDSIEVDRRVQSKSTPAHFGREGKKRQTYFGVLQGRRYWNNQKRSSAGYRGNAVLLGKRRCFERHAVEAKKAAQLGEKSSVPGLTLSLC